MPAINRRQAITATGSGAGKQRAPEESNWFDENSTVLYIVGCAVLTVLSSIVIFLIWRIVVRPRLRARGFCMPRSRRPRLAPTAEADHSDPYADPEEREEISDEERWRRQTIRIEWADPHRRSSFFIGKTQRGWDEGRDRLLFENEKEAGYGYGHQRAAEGGGRLSRWARSYYPTPLSPLSQLQASMARDDSYRTSARYAPSFTSSFGHTPDQSEIGRSDSQASHAFPWDPPTPSTRSPRPIHLLAPRTPYNPFSDPEDGAVTPLSSLAAIKPDLKPHYHPYPLFSLDASPVVAVIPKPNLPTTKPHYLPCPINTSYTPSKAGLPTSSSASTLVEPIGLSSSTSSDTLVEQSLSAPHRYPYPISTTPVNHRPAQSPSPPPIVITTPPSHSPDTFPSPASPASPWRSLRDSFRPRPPPKHGDEDEYDHYQLPIIRPGSAFVPFSPTAPIFTNFLDKEHRDRARERMSHMSTASGRADRTSKMYEMLWEEYGDEGDKDEEEQGRVVSSIYPPVPKVPQGHGSAGRRRSSSFGTPKMSRKSMMKPSPLRRINEV